MIPERSTRKNSRLPRASPPAAPAQHPVRDASWPLVPLRPGQTRTLQNMPADTTPQEFSLCSQPLCAAPIYLSHQSMTEGCRLPVSEGSECGSVNLHSPDQKTTVLRSGPWVELNLRCC